MLFSSIPCGKLNSILLKPEELKGTWSMGWANTMSHFWVFSSLFLWLVHLLIANWPYQKLGSYHSTEAGRRYTLFLMISDEWLSDSQESYPRVVKLAGGGRRFTEKGKRRIYNCTSFSINIVKNVFKKSVTYTWEIMCVVKLQGMLRLPLVIWISKWNCYSLGMCTFNFDRYC